MTAHLSLSLAIFPQKPADNRYNPYNFEAREPFSREILAPSFLSEKSPRTIKAAFAQASADKNGFTLLVLMNLQSENEVKGGESLC